MDRMIGFAEQSLPGGFKALVAPTGILRAQSLAIIWLHGIGERGTDLNLVLKYGLPAALAEDRLKTNATVICPQLEADLEWEPRRVAALMSYARTTYSRTALIGFSLGALGVCELLAELGPQSDQHVAIAPRTRRMPFASQLGTRLLSISGEQDPWPSSAAYLQGLRALGAVAEEVILPNEGHFISESALWHSATQASMQRIGIRIAGENAA